VALGQKKSMTFPSMSRDLDSLFDHRDESPRIA